MTDQTPEPSDAPDPPPDSPPPVQGPVVEVPPPGEGEEYPDYPLPDDGRER